MGSFQNFKTRRNVLKSGLAFGAGSMGLHALNGKTIFAAAQRAEVAPDLILYNANVYTVDANNRTANAIAIQGDKILAVGNNKDILDLGTGETRKFDLEGRTVTPGFIDAHPHMSGAGFRAGRRDWGIIQSIDDILAVIKKEVSQLKVGEWLVMPPIATPPAMYGYPETLREGRWPTRHDLDKVSPANPVYIEPHFLGVPGVAIANSLALKTANIPESGSPMQGTTIVRNDKGDPTGVFIDYNYPRMVPLKSWPFRFEFYPQIPRSAGREVALENVRRGMELFNTAGLTAIYEGHGCRADELSAFQKLHDQGELTIRSYCPLSFPVQGYDDESLADEVIARAARIGPGNGVGDDHFKVGGLGFSFDSAAAAGASLMREEYTRPNGQVWKGTQLTSNENLRRTFEKVAAAGLRIQAQCSGGAAIDTVLSIYQELHAKSSIIGKRWAIEHCQFPSQHNMETCKRLGVVPTSAVAFLWNYGKTYLESFGETVANNAIPYRSWLDAGVPLANSTDGDPYEPMFIFWQMLARKDGYTGRVLGPDERLTREQALRVYTMNPAYAAFWEDRIGSIEPGKLADLAILSQDIMTVPVDDIPDTVVVSTFVGGNPVHDLGLFGSL